MKKGQRPRQHEREIIGRDGRRKKVTVNEGLKKPKIMLPKKKYKPIPPKPRTSRRGYAVDKKEFVDRYEDFVRDEPYDRPGLRIHLTESHTGKHRMWKAMLIIDWLHTEGSEVFFSEIKSNNIKDFDRAVLKDLQEMKRLIGDYEVYFEFEIHSTGKNKEKSLKDLVTMMAEYVNNGGYAFASVFRNILEKKKIPDVRGYSDGGFDIIANVSSFDDFGNLKTLGVMNALMNSIKDQEARDAKLAQAKRNVIVRKERTSNFPLLGTPGEIRPRKSIRERIEESKKFALEDETESLYKRVRREEKGHKKALA